MNDLHQLWFVEVYSDGKQKRQEILKKLLDGNKIEPQGASTTTAPVIVNIFNFGYAHLFLNWVCGLHQNDLVHLKVVQFFTNLVL